MLSFSYIKPEPGQEYPWYDGTQSPWDPVAIRWQPEIWDCSRMVKHNHRSCVSEPNLPWHLNIKEIWVESRKAYEVLCRLQRPAGRRPLVRILPPRLPDFQQKRKPHDLIICSESDDDLQLATAIVKRTGGQIAHGARSGAWKLMAYAKCVVFALDRLGPLYWLAFAQAAGCRIVSSDAGAAEEYLCNYGRPGAWRVIHHGYKAELYVNAIEWLFGSGSDVCQTNYVDRTPWMNPWHKATERPPIQEYQI